MHVELAGTSALSDGDLAAARALLFDVFDDMAESDWEHALGGLHALVRRGPDVVGHASVVPRQLRHAGRDLRCGYVEGVAVRADLQRQGLGTALMKALQPELATYDLGALGATDEAVPLYTSLGWVPWRGRLSVLTPGGAVRTPEEEGAVYVLVGATPLDLDGELTCDHRSGDVW